MRKIFSIKKIKKGFTLTETALVLSIAAFAGFVAFSQIVRQEEFNKAGMAGSQIKLIGDSVNAYISNHYDTLSSLTNAPGTSADLGPRTCTAATNSCSITVATLVNEGLLPSSYSGKNVYGSNYNIVLKRNGTSPYYKINGMVTTASPIITGSNIRYDLLGQAMQKAGIDSGMTRGTSTTVSGFNGSWTATSADYSNINLAGLLAYQSGYGTYNYSVFLRRDGTLPMTGDLNMGSNDINNAVDYNGSGNITTGGRITAGSEITAKNGYGDAITLGGDPAGNDYELRLAANKQLTIYSPNSTQYSTVLNVNRNMVVNERIAANGLNPNDIPAGWGGGIRTFDVVASGTIALIKNGTSAPAGNLAAYMNLNGDIYASNSINSANTITAGGRVTGGDIYSNSETYTNNWFRTMGDGGIYFQKYGGGWNMADTATINAYGGKNISTSAGMYASYMQSSGSISASGNISGNGIYGNYVQSNGDVYSAGQTRSNGRLTTNEYVQVNGVAYVGNGCGPNGLVGRTPAGQITSCVNGVWRSPASTSIYYNSAQGVAYRFPSTSSYCNGSDVAVGGGGYCSSKSGFIWLAASYPLGTNGWYVACDQNLGNDGNSTATVFVKCQSSN